MGENRRKRKMRRGGERQRIIFDILLYFIYIIFLGLYILKYIRKLRTVISV